MATSRASAPKTRSVLIELMDGSQVLVEDIPSTAKITFGLLQPSKDSYNRDTAVRIYTSANNQLAVFRDARSFRDLSLSVKVSEITTTDDFDGTSGPNGSKSSRSRSVTHKLVPVQLPV